jgi:hypothetical protein
MIENLTETGKCYGVHMNVKNTMIMGISRQRSPIQIHQKQPENVEYFNFFDSMITYERYTREIKSRISMAKAAFNKKTLFNSKFDLNLREKQVNCCIWSIGFCGAETWTLRKTHQKYLESFEM